MSLWFYGFAFLSLCKSKYWFMAADFDEKQFLENLKKEHPGMQISSFDGDIRVVAKTLGIEKYPVPIDTSIPFALVKIVEQQYIDSLYKEGIVYMNTIGYFQNREDTKDGRTDNYEGIQSIAKIGAMYINGVRFDNITGFHFSTPTPNRGNIYCMYGIRNRTETDAIIHSIPKKMNSLGKGIILIKNPKLFIERCIKAAKQIGGDFGWGWVRYYDANEGSFFIDPWMKRKEFEYQSEYRIYIRNQGDNPITLRIGSIEDISDCIII